VWETARRCGRRLERNWAEETAALTREGRDRPDEAGKEEPARRTWTGTVAERLRKKEGRREVRAESARRRAAGRAAKVSLQADGSRAAADAKKASRPENATAVTAGASEARRKKRIRVWGGGRAMVARRPDGDAEVTSEVGVQNSDRSGIPDARCGDARRLANARVYDGIFCGIEIYRCPCASLGLQLVELESSTREKNPVATTSIKFISTLSKPHL
jgi:hypothetical protein